MPRREHARLALVHATHRTIALTGSGATELEEKDVLGSWGYVEKDAVCGEIANRQLALAYGTTGPARHRLGAESAQCRALWRLMGRCAPAHH